MDAKKKYGKNFFRTFAYAISEDSSRMTQRSLE